MAAPKAPAPRNFTELIELWPTDRALGRQLRLKSPRMVSRWRNDNWVPEMHWSDIAKCAAECGYNARLEEPITYALLSSFPRPAREPRPS